MTFRAALTSRRELRPVLHNHESACDWSRATCMGGRCWVLEDLVHVDCDTSTASEDTWREQDGVQQRTSVRWSIIVLLLLIRRFAAPIHVRTVVCEARYSGSRYRKVDASRPDCVRMCVNYEEPFVHIIKVVGVVKVVRPWKLEQNVSAAFHSDTRISLPCRSRLNFNFNHADCGYLRRKELTRWIARSVSNLQHLLLASHFTQASVML